MPKTGKTKSKKPHRFYDYSLLFTIIFLTVFGLIMIYSASAYKAQMDYGNPAYFAMRQAAIAAGGGIVMYIVSKINYHWFEKFALFAYSLSWITMLLTMLTPLGVASHGKKRWLRVGPGILQFQPTELVKISLILLLAVLISQMGSKVNKLKPVGRILLLSAPLAFLVTVNNLSSGIIICGIIFVMLFVACKIKWPFFLCIGSG
ncbi:MAG: FtsW/RodA/SpoVE family cell cycle protein, partial [Clostridium sp.]